MPVDPLGGTLASIALLFPIYDACNRIYNGCQVMKAFGRDVQILYILFDVQWVKLHQIMQRQQYDLADPLDPDNEHHRVTSAVKSLLSVLETHFRKCESLVQKQFDKSELALPSLTGTSDLLENSSVPTPTASSSSVPISGGQTPEQTKPSGTDTGFKNFFRGKIRRKARKGSNQESGSSSVDSSMAPPDSNQSDLRRTLPIPQLSGAGILALSNQSHESRLIQMQTGIWTHIKWAHHDKDEFRDKIGEIREILKDLDQILMLKPPKRLGNLLALKSPVASESYSPLEVREDLQRIHNALKAVNGGLETSPWSIGVYAISKPADNWMLLHDQTKLPLRTGSSLFYIQRFRTLEPDNESTFLMIESPHVNNISNLPRISTLNDPLQTTVQMTSEGYEAWGHVTAARTPEDQHSVFAETKKWRVAKSLSAFLDDETFRAELALSNLVQLAEIILTAHIDFCQIRSQCQNLRIESFVYYNEPKIEGQKEIVNAEGPLFLRPYVSCGFGQSQPHRRMGATSRSSAKDPNAAVIELGLILFQLGSHKKLPYKAYTAGDVLTDLQAAKKGAIRNLPEVENRYGLSFANIIEVCLASSSLTESEDIADCLSALEVIRDSLEK